MSRSKKDGRRGGNHRYIKDYGDHGLANGKPGGWDDFTPPEVRRFLKKKVSRDRRRISREIGFEEGEKHLQSEELSTLQMPRLDYQVYIDITRALKQVSNPEFLLEFLRDIADMSDLLEDNTYIQALVALAKNNDSWIRPLETWCPETPHPDEQFPELTRHLFAAYDVPRFMDNAWLDSSPVHQGWFKHIAAGQNIRTAPGLPFVLTKKMAHHFLTAPEEYTIAEALRWGQVHALGGNTHLADALRGTYLVRALNRGTVAQDFWFVEDDFWLSVIRFFIANPMNVRDVSPIIDYIRHQKYTGQPAQPNFSMNGRTPEALLRQVRAWHAELQREARKEGKKGRRRHKWKGSGIDGFHFQQGNRTWHIIELTNRDELYAEGKAMKHCVLSYFRDCEAGKTSIWAMAFQDEEGVWKKAVTIQVDPHTRRITQVRGPLNRDPRPGEKVILKIWAAKAGLTIPAYIN